MRNDLLAYSIAFLSLALTVCVLVLVLILLRAPISLFLLFCFIIVAVPFINTVILFLMLNRYKKKWINIFLFSALLSLLIVIFILIYGAFIQPMVLSDRQYYNVVLCIGKLLEICILVILCTQFFISILVCVKIPKNFAFITLFAQSIFLISLMIGLLFFSDLTAGL
jgi:hypothetical protein